MSDTPQDPDAGTQEGGYGYPTLEQEVTPEVLHAGDAPAGSGDAAHAGTPSDEDEDGGDGSAPGELVEDPAATEPTD